jgi:hypothetical protein
LDISIYLFSVENTTLFALASSTAIIVFVLVVHFRGTEMETIRQVFQIVGGLACALLAIGALGWSLKSMMKNSKEQADKKMSQR